jgi:hypothetical protein
MYFRKRSGGKGYYGSTECNEQRQTFPFSRHMTS